MEKLLLLGIDTSTKYILEYCRSIGVHTIISDMHPADLNPVKKLADENWQIDVKDLDKLEDACRKEGVTGVYNGNHDICLDYVRELSLRLFGEFYASDRAWECSRDKLEFKKECTRVGLKVPKSYNIFGDSLEAGQEELSFPLVVKPADSFASQGLSICNNPEELEKGIELAYAASPKKRIVIEERIDGDEYGVGFIFNQGKASLVEFTSLCKYDVNNVKRIVFAKHDIKPDIREEYLSTVHDRLLKLFSNIRADNGGGFIQMVYRDHTFYPLEFGYRLDGVGSWMTRKLTTGFSTVDYMISVALHRDLSCLEDKVRELSASIAYYGGEYFPAVRSGRIARIEGLETVKSMDRVEIILERFHEGDQVGITNSMYQIAYYISFGAQTAKEATDMLKKINDTLQFYDEDGTEMLYKYENYELFK